MTDDRPSPDPLEEQLRQELSAKAAATQVTFSPDDVALAADAGRSVFDHSARYYLGLAAAVVVAVGIGVGIWGLTGRSAPLSIEAAGPPEAAEGERDRPVEDRVASLVERDALIESALSDQDPPALGAQWMAPNPMVIDVDGLGLVAVGPPDPEPQISWEAEVTTDSRCVTSSSGLACGPLIDDLGQATSYSAGATNGRGRLAEDGRTVLVSTRDSSQAWLLATGLPEEVVLVEMRVGNTTIGQVPVENTVALFHPLGAAELDLVGFDANATTIWTTTFEPQYPIGAGADDYDQALVDATGFGPLIPPPSRLGEAWSEFSLDSAEGLTLTATPRDGCPGATQDAPTFEAGVYVEYGLGPSPDDASIIVVTEATTDLAAVYTNFQTLLCGTTPLAEFPIPELPGAIESTRFLVDDDLGQSADGIIVLREDFVLFVSVGVFDGVEPVDIDILVAEMLAAYDTGR